MPFIRLTDEDYRHYAQNQPELPLWQSLPWKSYQEALGRETRLYGLISEPLNLQTSKPSNPCRPKLQEERRLVLAAALIIIDRTAFGLSTWDIPRGPTGNPDYCEELLSGIIEEAKKERCMAVYFSPSERSNFQTSKPSSRHEHPEATVIIDLTKSDEEILKAMHEKGRYNIRLAERHGVLVEPSADIDAFYALLKQTGARDRYGIKPKSHYEKFLALPGSFLLLACEDTGTQKNALAGLMGVISGETGIYYYGASDHTGRAKMAPSLLQFAAMKYCRAQGATRYDLFGIAPNDDPHHPWAGVTRFKKQFGGSVVMYPPEQEVMLMPVAKKLIEWKRKIIG